MSEKLDLGKEYEPADEKKFTNLLAQLLIDNKEKNTEDGKVQRAFHTKMHGCVDAEFIVKDNLPELFRVGLFKDAKTYKAKIRFSNGAHTVDDDAKKGFRGMAIKLLDVAGTKLAIGEENLLEHDLVTFSSPVIAPGDVESTYIAMNSMFKNKLSLLLYALNPKNWHVVKNLLVTTGYCSSLLQESYYSACPYRFGSELDSKAIKFKITPSAPLDLKMPENPSKNFLKEILRKDLKQSDFYFDYKIQFQEDPNTMPIENVEVEWKSDFHKIATIKIPKQEFDTPQKWTIGDNLSFQPWHAIAEHRPLGGINRARRVVYHKLSKYRLEHKNTVPK